MIFSRKDLRRLWVQQRSWREACRIEPRKYSSRSVCFYDLIEDRDVAASSGHELGAFNGREYSERFSLNRLCTRSGFSQRQHLEQRSIGSQNAPQRPRVGDAVITWLDPSVFAFPVLATILFAFFFASSAPSPLFVVLRAELSNGV